MQLVNNFVSASKLPLPSFGLRFGNKVEKRGEASIRGSSQLLSSLYFPMSSQRPIIIISLPDEQAEAESESESESDSEAKSEAGDQAEVGEICLGGCKVARGRRHCI